MTGISITNNCHACGEPLSILDVTANLCSVTSDCRPWHAQAEIAVCRSCGLSQKKITPEWVKEIEDIYGSYAMYPQGGGAEQASFESESGVTQARSAKIVEAVASHNLLTNQGKMLDVGCGNGHMIRSFQNKFPAWGLAGQEWDERHAKTVRAIPNVTDFFTSFPDDHVNSFDLISMVHVLEHIVDPANYLRNLASLLRDGGLLLIEVPNLRRNPYDLAIFDHCSHFTASSLRTVLAESGFEIRWLSEGIVSKELTALCCIGTLEADSATTDDLKVTQENMIWLQSFKQQFINIESKAHLGIFGTSIGASWVVSELRQTPGFFLDEDINRIGKYHLEKPIFAPDDAPQGSTIIIPLTTESSAAVSARLSRPDLKFISPS